MIIVLADDFSGAAEMAGIAYRFGLTTEVQMNIDLTAEADVLVIDTNTRAMDQEEAVIRIKEIAGQLKKFAKPISLFKKVDSVMRGHIAAEADALQQVLNYKRVLLFPANPGKKRVIRSGNYFVNNIPLDKTAFKDDPVFPISSSSVKALLEPQLLHLPHVHLQPYSSLPDASFITGDVEVKEDIQNYIRQTNVNDLCCGAAECFEGWLEHQGYIAKPVLSKEDRLPYTLIINGSTIKSNTEKELFWQLGIPQISIPGHWTENEFEMDKEEENLFHEKALDVLQFHHSLALYIDHPVKKQETKQDIFSVYFINLIHYISNVIERKQIHFCLTGGATAFAIIKSEQLSCLTVKEEIAPGIVTLKPINGEKGWFTVKPGSYPWPESLLKKSINNQ